MEHLSGSASIVMILTIVAIALGVTLIVCWIVLPFAVIGVKPLLRELIREQQTANQLAQANARALETLAARYPPPPR